MKRVLTFVLCALVLSACGSSDNTISDVDSGTTAISGGTSRTVGVNSYLWHG